MSKSIIFEPKEFLKIAEDIHDTLSSEAAYRTVINRSFLSVVLEASILLEPLVGELPTDHTFYQKVEEALSKRNAIKSKDKVSTLRSLRIDADYRVNEPITKNKADWALSIAKYLFDHMKDEIV